MSNCHVLIDALRQKGFRVTPQREMIVESIAHGGSHMTADDIFAQVQARTQTVNIATVYRTLELLIDEGLVCRTDLGGDKVFYATMEHGPHVHLVCRNCEKVIDANQELLHPLGDQLKQKYQFRPNLQHVSIFGHCADCQGEK